MRLTPGASCKRVKCPLSGVRLGLSIGVTSQRHELTSLPTFVSDESESCAHGIKSTVLMPSTGATHPNVKANRVQFMSKKNHTTKPA